MLDRRHFIAGAAVTATLADWPVLARSTMSGPADIRNRVTAYLRPLVERYDYSGFVLLQRGGRTLMADGFGFADDARRIAHTGDTHYASASTGKATWR